MQRKDPSIYKNQQHMSINKSHQGPI